LTAPSPVPPPRKAHADGLAAPPPLAPASTASRGPAVAVGAGDRGGREGRKGTGGVGGGIFKYVAGLDSVARS